MSGHWATDKSLVPHPDLFLPRFSQYSLYLFSCVSVQEVVARSSLAITALSQVFSRT